MEQKFKSCTFTDTFSPFRTVIALMYAHSIQFNSVYYALHLTNYLNHYTQTKHEDLIDVHAPNKV